MKLVNGDLDEDLSTTATIYGLFNFARGIGNVLCAPVSSGLLSDVHNGTTTTSTGNGDGAEGGVGKGGEGGKAGLGYGVSSGDYAGMILFVGSLMAAAGVVEIVNGILKRRKKRD